MIWSTEIVVALVTAAGVVGAGLVAGVTAFLTTRYQARRQDKKEDAQFIIDRDKLVWEQAGKFWDDRAAELTRSVQLERTAREAETAALKADIALLKSDNAQLNQAKVECESRVKAMEGRLTRAGEQLQVVTA